ncbi:uncharacterized protein LOC126672328 [Mercurialis annua]|uniref:uncharacterized protein LOC126672328 n=1 Tax=Mercurialis annua TaxID=3986 RepID=UPI002160EE71|nr:uncharacterized protein LOC126672328 [Mercurialis annua]
MEKYFKRKTMSESLPSVKNQESCNEEHQILQGNMDRVDLDNLPSDPALRKPIADYNPNIQEEVRRRYLQKGPCQPREHNYKHTLQGTVFRRFCHTWFDEHSSWLEYNKVKEAAYCFCCYLFKPESKGHTGSSDAFVVEGFTNWKKKEKLQIHIGGPNSAHNQAVNKCQNLMNQRQHLQTIVNKQSSQSRSDYRNCLNTSIECVRYLLRQGFAFRGHDESNKPGNLKATLQLLCDHNEDIKRVAIDQCPRNLKLTSPDIQKDIVHACAIETTNSIIHDLGNNLFSILVDESRDVACKEQMAMVIRYVNKEGKVVERLLDIVHVQDICALSLKASIEAIFSKYSLSISRLQGQGYDGASNMQGAFNGLKTLILKENESAFYVHCFAHQLQLALVGVAKNHISIALLFTIASSVVNVVGGSSKRHDLLLEIQAINVLKAIESGELESGQGKNQESTLKRAGETRWGSHYSTLLSLIKLFSSIVDVLEFVRDNGKSYQKVEACFVLDSLQSFETIFCLHLMKHVLGITNELSQTLQRKDQDIVNAMTLVKIAKQRLQLMRDSGWNSLMDEVTLFCNSHDIQVPNMEDVYIPPGRSRRNFEKVKNMHHYKVEVFSTVIDLQLQELNNRFNEVNTELLLCFACLNPSHLFSAYDKAKLLRVAQFYPMDFSDIQCIVPENQLETFILDMKSSCEFSNISEIGNLVEIMVQTKDILYPLVYKLLTLALILPVATATVERSFSAMKYVKNRLRNKMGDQWMSNCLITYVEIDVFNSIDNEVIMHRYQGIKNRREQL